MGERAVQQFKKPQYAYEVASGTLDFHLGVCKIEMIWDACEIHTMTVTDRGMVVWDRA